MPKLRCPRGVESVRHARRALAFAIALLILPLTPVYAETYDVCESGCPYRSIQAAINAANPGQNIRVGPGTYYESLVLRPRISVAGNGQNQTTIRGNGSQPVVRADDSQIARDTVVENLSIAGGGGDRGGGLLVSSGAKPTVRNVTIRDNSTSQLGAGITVQNGANLLLEGALIRNNAAPSGSGLTVNDGQATVRDTTIENNVSNGDSQSGAVSVQSGATATFANVTIRGTTAHYGGGLRVVNSSTVTMTGGRIENNRATGSGGGVLMNNSATVTLNGVTVSGNSAPTAGGLYVADSQLVIDGSRFANNSASTTSGGAIYLIGVGGEISNSTFENNRAALVGGAIHFDQANNSLLLSSTLTGNTAIDGAAVYVTAGRVRIIKNRIVANSAGQYGGGIVATASAIAQIRRNEISRNTAGLDGGGIIYQRASSGLMDGNLVSQNHAGNVGGGMTIYDRANPTLLDNRFVGNTAEVGGAIQIEENVAPLLDGNEYIGNVANLHGGAVTITFNADPVIKNGLFKDNRAQVEGGAIYIQRNSQATLENNVIIGNWAGVVGGGILVHQDRGSSITGNYIAGNRSDQHGGGIYLNETNATVDGNQIVGNTAHQLGGGLVLLNGSSTVSNNLIANNRGNHGGAGIYMAGSSARLTSNTIADNGRNAGGDGILLNAGANPRLMYNVVVGNDHGVRSSGGQPALMTRNNVWGNRLADYAGVQRGDTDLNTDPRWVNGPLGPYYLSHQAAGQPSNSQLIDACFDSSHAMGVDQVTTRTDGQRDRNNADMGFHYRLPLGRTMFLPAVRVG